MNVSLLAVVNLSWMPNATHRWKRKRDVPALVGSGLASLSPNHPPSNRSFMSFSGFRPQI